MSWPKEAKETPPVVESQLIQDSDGLLIDERGPHYREISGILAFDGAALSSLGRVTAGLFINPYATHPLGDRLGDFPRTFVKDGEFGHESGKSVAEMLELQAGWPGMER